MLREEFAHVLGDPSWKDPSKPLASLFKKMHTWPADQRPSALCLSGGGIRSATFCLGVLQWLAKERQLQQFHYLSTVSGGGYIGSWLVNGLRQAGWPFINDAEAAAKARINAARQVVDRAADTAAREPYADNIAAVAAAERALAEAMSDADARKSAANAQAATATAAWLDRVGQSSGSVGAASAAGAARTGGDAPDPVAPLRAFSNYLSPTGGLSGDAFSLAAIFVRNLLLNALVWLPLLAAIVALPRLYIAWLAALPLIAQPLVAMTCAAVVIGSVAAILIRNLLDKALVWMVLPLVAALLLIDAAFVKLFEDASGFAYAVTASAWVAIVIGVAYVVADLPAKSDSSPVPTAPTAAAQQAAAVAAVSSMLPRDRFFLACFTPIILAAIVLSLGGAWITTLRDLPRWSFPVAGAVAHAVGMVCGAWWRKRRGLSQRPRNLGGFIVVLLVGAFGGWLASIVLTQLGPDRGAAGHADEQRLLYATFAVPAMTGAFWLAMALYAGLMGRLTDEQDREWWARATGAWLKFSVLWVAAFALVAWLPLPILDALGATGPTALQFGVGGGVLGIVTSLIGYWGKNGDELKRKAQSFLRATGLKLLDAMAALVVVTTLLGLSMGWSLALDRCHGWRWATALCPTDLHGQTEYLREHTRLRAEHQAASKGVSASTAAAALALEPFDVDAAEPGRSASAQVYRHVMLEADGRMLFTAIVMLLVFAVALALAMGVNVFSLHGMYGNRLVRAYLGSGRAQRRPHWFTGFDPDDNLELHLLEAPLRHPNGQPRLYPLINIALNIVRPSPQHLDWQQRKAASFIATPRHCGAAPVGYRPTDRYAGGMSLGRALTISGAAASPNMGYHSSTLVTFVMTLFNVRLGWWSPNPRRTTDDRWRQSNPWIGLDVAWAEATGSTGVDDRFVYLSDGGHFDNLGIYEMVRRRCHRIVAVDATCDGKFNWTDLLDVVRKIRVDFGIPIELPAVLPGQKGEAVPARFFEATIRYSARDGNDHKQDGTLIVLKPRLLPLRDPPELAAYAAASVADGSPSDDPLRFPHQSTADQFFNEQQFESYRLLGYLTAADTLGSQPPFAATAAPDLGRRVAPMVAPHCPATPACTGTPGQTRQDPIGTGADVAAGGGLGYLIHQMGTGAVLATALTIGGTLGVAGTVALAPTELRFSDTDRTLLKDGMALRVNGGELKVNVSADGSALQDPALRLATAAIALSAAAAKLDSIMNSRLPASAAMTLDAGDSLRTLVANLQEQIRLLGNSIGSAASSWDLARTTRTIATIERRLERIESRLPEASNAKELNEALNGIKSALEALKPAVEGIAPRRNVRGQDGGSR